MSHVMAACFQALVAWSNTANLPLWLTLAVAVQVTKQHFILPVHAGYHRFLC